MTLSPRLLFHRLLERRAERLAERLAPHLPRGGRVLDIGSGTGHNAEALSRFVGGTCLEVDVVDFHVVGDGPIRFDGRRLPLTDGAVDFCLLVHVLSYSDDPAAVLREARRVANRGVILVQTSYRGLLGWAFLRGRGWIQGRGAFRLCRTIGLVPAVENPMRTRRCFTRVDLQTIAREAGLLVETLEPEPRAVGLVSRDLMVLRPSLVNDDPGAEMSNRTGGPSLSVVIPARNEAALLGPTLESVLNSIDDLRATTECRGLVEALVVDDGSSDGTPGLLDRYAAERGVRVARCEVRGAARARNLGARLAQGRILVFLDADTHLPVGGLRRIATLCHDEGIEAGITKLGALDGGLRARSWWAFWNTVRRLPLPRAKAMPACMFCTREAFDEFGPFDERVAIGEEWPILAGLYRARPRRFIYDRTTIALSSGRRMELQRWGYLRTFLKYGWAILSFRGRIHYHDHIRHTTTPFEAT